MFSFVSSWFAFVSDFIHSDLEKFELALKFHFEISEVDPANFNSLMAEIPAKLQCRTSQQALSTVSEVFSS